MTPDDKFAHMQRYFDRMSAPDIAGIIDLFDETTFVFSPFLGKMRASEFLQKLGIASNQSTLTIFDILLGHNGNSAAAHFEYDWTLKSGEQFVFQDIDYFKFSENRLFASMSIFYDTHPVRQDVGDKYASA